MKAAVLDCGFHGRGIAYRLAREVDLTVMDHDPRKASAAQIVFAKLESAVVKGLGPTIVPSPDHGELSRTELEPMDEQARAGLAARGLGPGISSARFESRRVS
jgi:hypothetical protein